MMKQSYIYLLMLVGLASLLGQTAYASDTDVDLLRLKKLKQYAFNRTLSNYDDVQLLMGNAEMGATARQDGLGFDRLWFSDFWRTASARILYMDPNLRCLMPANSTLTVKYSN